MFYTEFIAKDKPERRYVEYKDQNITHSSDRMPIEWWSWLHNRREDIPTANELALSARKQESLAARVAVLEAEDEKQRLRQFAGGAKTAKATDEEVSARRRKKALLGLVNAASPSQDTDSYLSPQTGPPAQHGAENQSMNSHQDPKVFAPRLSSAS